MPHTPPAAELTRLLHEWSEGDESAREALWPMVYGALKKLARAVLAEQSGSRPLETTVLVHELYLRLSGGEGPAWENRGHFFALAARAMRYILVDQIRRRRAVKRGGREIILPLDDSVEIPLETDVDLLALDDALKDLERLDPRRCRVLELSFFAGLTYEEIGDGLDISPATVKRDLRTAKMWLLRELRRDETSPSRPGDGNP